MERRRPTAVYWGRFNPPHSGHLDVIRRFRRGRTLVVAIGSSDRKGERRNPFDGRQRKEMMEAYLAEAGIRDVRVVTLPDGPSRTWAVDRMLRRCRPDQLLLSTETRGLAKLAERRVTVVRFRRTGTISSTRIRNSIAAGRSDWRRLTGLSVSRWIEDHHGIETIQAAYARIRRRPAGGSGAQRSWGSPPLPGSTGAGSCAGALPGRRRRSSRATA